LAKLGLRVQACAAVEPIWAPIGEAGETPNAIYFSGEGFVTLRMLLAGR
jgi:hypothetical protein